MDPVDREAAVAQPRRWEIAGVDMSEATTDRDALQPAPLGQREQPEERFVAARTAPFVAAGVAVEHHDDTGFALADPLAGMEDGRVDPIERHGEPDRVNAAGMVRAKNAVAGDDVDRVDVDTRSCQPGVERVIAIGVAGLTGDERITSASESAAPVV